MDLIEDIRNKTDIVAVVSEYVQLKKRGRNYLGLCPFHSEKTASFTVSPEKQIFHCFGCHEGGNVFTFLMKIENIGFAEALAELGEKAGISVPKPGKASAASKNEQDKIYQIMQLAAKFFAANLFSPAGKEAHDYLACRKISGKTGQLYGLGYALPDWESLFKHLIERGAAPTLIEKSGLVLPREGQAGGFYDRFRRRLMVPIRDPRGRVMAFGGRALGAEEPKYLNSPESPVYHKSENLFGLDLAKEAIKKEKTAVLVEGYFDQITPFQAGINNVVASLGTAMTAWHGKILARMAETVILAFDADSAGEIAAERSVDILRKEGVRVKIAQLAGAKDPDEMVRQKGEAAFLQCLSSALPYLEFKIKRTLARCNLKDIEARASALREIAAVLGQEKDPFVQNEYAKQTAGLLQIEPDVLKQEICRLQHYTSAGKSAALRAAVKPPLKIDEAEKNLIALAVQDRGILTAIKETETPDSFSSAEAREITALLFSPAAEKADNLIHFVLENTGDEKVKNYLSAILLREHLSEEGKKEPVLKDCLSVLHSEKKGKRIAALKTEIRAAESGGKPELAAKLLAQLKGEISGEAVR
ncbi:MAG: DNA primase [Candidatus Margulisbacteria bacterium]|nr:DNA primase [Candidatus Margulisiibacteriota bacterium]